jgi:hypothetical protein
LLDFGAIALDFEYPLTPQELPQKIIETLMEQGIWLSAKNSHPPPQNTCRKFKQYSCLTPKKVFDPLQIRL